MEAYKDQEAKNIFVGIDLANGEIFTVLTHFRGKKIIKIERIEDE